MAPRWLFLIFAVHVACAAALCDAPAPAKVHADVHATLCREDTGVVSPALIRLPSTANLDDLAFEAGTTRAQRRSAVRDHLMAFTARSQAPVVDILRKHAVEHEPFWIVNAVAARNLSKAAAAELAASDAVALVDTDAVGTVRRVAPPSAHLVPTSTAASPARGSKIQPNIAKVAAPDAWAAGYNGSGISLATLDGGVNFEHEVMADNYRGAQPGGGYDHDYNWADWAYHAKAPSDSDGHGSNVAGIATATKGYGVAPGARWFTGKIYNFAGYSAQSWTIAGTQWVLCPTPVGKTSPADCSRGADVVSCSWGDDNDHTTYLQQYIAAWIKAGTVPVFAVGNAGPKCATSVSPADYTGVVGVGASNNNDEIMAYSSRGPTTNATGYEALTPSIVAPGYDIEGPAPDDVTGYKGFSGTSQACPHVAGAAALVLSAAGEAAGTAEVKRALLESAQQKSLQGGSGDTCGGRKWNEFPNFVFGYGRVDCLAAVKAATAGELDERAARTRAVRSSGKRPS